MSNESSLDWPGIEPPPLLPNPRRRWPLILFVVFVLALASAGACYAWLNGGLFIQTTGHEAATEADAGSSDRAVITDLLASQQKTSEDLAAIDRTIADQQEQLKAIVSQLSSLSAKIDALKGPAPQAPVAPPFPSPPAVAAPGAPPAHTAPAPPARTVQKQKRPQPRGINPTGPISVGGAPLNTAPDATAH